MINDYIDRLFYGHITTDFNIEIEKKAEKLLIDWCEGFKRKEMDGLKFIRNAVKLSYEINYLNSYVLEDLEDYLTYCSGNVEHDALLIANKLIKIINEEGSGNVEVKKYADSRDKF